MSWADEASREATESAEQRNAQLERMIEEAPRIFNPIEFVNTPVKIFESLRPVDGECPCEENHAGGKCGSTSLTMNSGFCTACVFGCLP